MDKKVMMHLRQMAEKDGRSGTVVIYRRQLALLLDEIQYTDELNSWTTRLEIADEVIASLRSDLNELWTRIKELEKEHPEIDFYAYFPAIA